MKPIKQKGRGWRYWLKLCLMGLVGGLVLFPVGYLKLYMDVLTGRAGSSICCITPADRGFQYESVTFTSSDGVTLSGWYIPSRNKAAVILLHGYGGNREGMMFHAGILAQQGYGVLLYDLRAHGESEGQVRSWGWLDVKDVFSALAYLQRRSDLDPNRIGVLGSSVGGQIAIRAAVETDKIKAVVADGPSIAVVQDLPPPATLKEWLQYLSVWLVDRALELRMGVSPPPPIVHVIANIAPRPILLISTGQDKNGIELDTVRRYYNAAGEPKTLWEIPEAWHGGGPQARPEEYTNRIITFFDQALLGNLP